MIKNVSIYLLIRALSQTCHWSFGGRRCGVRFAKKYIRTITLLQVKLGRSELGGQALVLRSSSTNTTKAEADDDSKGVDPE